VRSSSQLSNISALALATRSPPSAAESAVFETAGPLRGHRRRQRPSVFAKAVTDEENLANKSLVDERTPLVRPEVAVRSGRKAAVSGHKAATGRGKAMLGDAGELKGSGRNLIQEEKVETKAVGFKAREAVPLTLILSFNPHIQFFAYGTLLTFCRESKEIKFLLLML
jgi:hypothetical protein